MGLQYDKIGVGGVQGAGPNILGAEPPRSLKVADSLLKIAGAVGDLANKVGEKEDEARGQAAIMQASLEGKAKETLQAAATDENKWYNKMWGPSAFYRGMQSMAAEAQAGQFLAEETERLHRKPKDGGTASLDPQLYAASLVERIQSVKTGDPHVDAQIIKSMMPVAQRLAGIQAEKFAEYANVQAQSDDSANILNRVRAHETLTAGKGLAPDAQNSMIAESAKDLYAAFTTQPQGYKTDNFIKNRTDMVVAGLKSNSDMLFNFWKNSGWMDKASPEEQLKVIQAHREYRDKQVTDDMAQVFKVGALVQEAVEAGKPADAVKLAMQSRALTDKLGIKPLDFAEDLNAYVRLYGKAYNKQVSLQVAAMREAKTADKLQEELAEKVTTNQKMLLNVLSGRPHASVNVKGVNVIPSDQDLLKLHEDLAVADGQMSIRDRVLQARKFDVVDPTARAVGSQLPGLVGAPSSASNAHMLEALDQMLEGTGGNVKILKNYIEDETTFHKVQQYADLLRTTGNRDYAYKMSFAIPPEAKSKLEPKAIREAAGKMFEHKWLGENGSLYDAAEHQHALQPILEQEIENISRSNPNMTAEQAAREAARTVAAYSVEQIGTKSIVRFNSKHPTLMQQSGLTNPHAVDSAVQEVFRQRKKSAHDYHRIDVDDYLVQQNHQGQYVMVPTKDGWPVLDLAHPLDGRVLQDAWAATYRDPKSKPQIPSNTFLTKERSDAARKAYAAGWNK